MIKSEAIQVFAASSRLTTAAQGYKASIVARTLNREIIFIGDSTDQETDLDGGDSAEVGGQLIDQVYAKGTPTELPIDAVDQGLDTFRVDGDESGRLDAGDRIDITGSTGNDGSYIISSVAFNGSKTTLGVEEEIPDANNDGVLAVADKVSIFREG